MSIDFSSARSLKDVLALINRAPFERFAAGVKDLKSRYDYRISEKITSRLVAKPRTGNVDVVVKIINFVPRHIYTVIAKNHEVEIHLGESGGGNSARHDRYRFELMNGREACGHIDYFPNNNFVFTNKESCLGFGVIHFDGKQYLQFQAETNESLLIGRPYSITVDDAEQNLALIAEQPSWLLSKKNIKLAGKQDPLLAGILMAAHHGLIFKPAS